MCIEMRALASSAYVHDKCCSVSWHDATVGHTIKIALRGSVFGRPFAKTCHALRARKYIYFVPLHSQDRQHTPIGVRLGKEDALSMHSIKLAASDFNIPEQRMVNCRIFENANYF